MEDENIEDLISIKGEEEELSIGKLEEQRLESVTEINSDDDNKRITKNWSLKQLQVSKTIVDVYDHMPTMNREFSEDFEDIRDVETAVDDEEAESSEEIDSKDTEQELQSLYGLLSSALKQVEDIYHSKATRLSLTQELTLIFITFLDIHKDIAYEMASIIVDSRSQLPITKDIHSHTIVKQKYRSKMRSADDLDQNDNKSALIDDDDEWKNYADNKIRIGLLKLLNSIVKGDANDQLNVSDNSSNEFGQRQSNTICPLHTRHFMTRVTSYLSKADWRAFDYLSKHFFQSGTITTVHALEFSSALLNDLIEESVYNIYFRTKWCHKFDKDVMESYIDNRTIKDFLVKSLAILLIRLNLIHLPLLEHIVMIRCLKRYSCTDLYQGIISKEFQAPPISCDSCVWYSTDILIKAICSMKDYILSFLEYDYLSSYVQFEYLLTTYFRKIQIILNINELDQYEEKEQKCLLHVIDVKQAPKFFSEKAFKRFQLGKNSQLHDLEELKDLILLDISKKVIKSRIKVESSASITRTKINRNKGEEEQILLINSVIDQIIEKDENLTNNLKKLELHRTAKEETIDVLIDDEDKLEKSVDKQ
ncbi:unnamed protein product [Didymodactylos carnosus]|uniref:Uncharacterized protein n=1 Tax=Didymodactylos carnosus TaxID=1234261 RepID=A0A814SIJ1_9BILA|nr:unnamed protein product [Didymodactylos carnosus]CAF3912279.1 unnamed protein product [Didymodactylos carnosus]